MKQLIAGFVLALLSGAALAATQVDGYVRKDGTYAPPHYRSAPDNSRSNNYSSQGRTNPYTGQQGTVDPYTVPAPRAPAQPAWGDPPRRTW